MVKPSDLLRYGLWGMVAATADANRREYHMTTTWLPHFLTYTLILLLPDIYGALVPEGQDYPDDLIGDLRQSLDAMVRDNPDYATYVVPVAVGFILSHPRFNIYKGELAEIRLGGFGLDALPHGATALAFTALYTNMIDRVAPSLHSNSPLSVLIQESERNPTALSGAMLAALTLWWEVGEYMIHRHELALRGDVKLINMQWGWRDTLNDCAANVIGWGLALAWRGLKRNRSLRA